jgi:aldehyde dehydrogenase (NAD+)
VWVLDQFTRWQAMNWDYSGRLQKAQMDVPELTADLTFRLGEP